ncbi:MULTISPECIES: hypothetical protein [unclassified Bacillus (in: firmicutes)]|uniref:hypothetical protein n=1 Tax=unclassified Bacillus (in: firmicutes) TaxID=185979 RepID=UPI0030102F47
MITLDTEYIEKHLESVNNYDSFGRSLCAAILNECLKLVKGDYEEKIQLTADISVSTTTNGCMVKIKIGPEEICKLVPLIETKVIPQHT